MHRTEQDRQCHSPRPESDRLRECELHVAAKREFFVQPNYDKYGTPNQRPTSDGAAVKFQNAEAVTAKCCKCGENRADFRDAEHGALHELLCGVSPEAQAVLAEFPALQQR